MSAPISTTELPLAVKRRLETFISLLLAENERINLTAIRKPADAWRLHVCDSLALLPLIHAAGPKSLLDLGTGGGVPGLPIAIACPDVGVTLIDATRKKLEAVERIATALELPNVRFRWGRAEELAHQPELRERFDAVTARAVAALPHLLEFVAGFVRVGGASWLFQTQSVDVTEAAATASACGLEFSRSLPYRLEGDTQERLILCYDKHFSLAAELPRHPSVAKGTTLKPRKLA